MCLPQARGTLGARVYPPTVHYLLRTKIPVWVNAVEEEEKTTRVGCFFGTLIWDFPHGAGCILSDGAPPKPDRFLKSVLSLTEKCDKNCTTKY